MFTKNGKKMLKYIMYKAVDKSFEDSLENYTGLTETFKSVDGNLHPYTDLNRYNIYLFPDHRSNVFFPRTGQIVYNSGIYFGSGSDTPTEDDYTITPITTSASITNVSGRSYNDANEKVFFDMVFAYKNNSSEAVTIREFGVFNGANSNNRIFLIYRDVLDTPVTIEAGETKNIKITISMEY